MPVADDIRLADGDHVVQFYGAETELTSAVVGYLSGAARDGDAVIVIATPEHRDAFDVALRVAGVEVDDLRARGRLVVVDAAETLSRFMVDDVPDRAAFEAVVGGLVRSTAAGGRVRAYGEMVAVLWDAGNVTAAIALEQLWNDLGELTPFSLFCAYPAHMVSGSLAADDFSAVCHLHSHVVAGAPTPDGAEVTRRFAGTTQAPRLARSLVAETLQAWDRADLIDDAVLVVSELTTNAVMHADSDVTVGLSRHADVVRLEVGDASAAVPEPRGPDSTALGGRGLVLVDRVAGEWGHRLVVGGKLVWAELDADVTGRT
jgi:anti-sigma regulatory factor (Ser/Thr protein kinase)